MPKKAPFRKRTSLVPPSSFSVSDTTTTSITLTWVDTINSTHEGYEITRNGQKLLDPNGNEIAADDRSFIDVNLDPETIYQYAIRAVSSLGNSTSITVEGTTDEPLPSFTTTPMNATANDGATASFFVAGINITTYQWEISTDGGSNWSEIGGATSSSYTTGTLSGADDGNQYRCKIYNDSLDEVISSAATLTVISATLLAPTGLTATVASTTQVDLAWTDNATTETEYRIYRNNSLLDTIAANSSGYSDNTVSSGNSYTYKVSVWDGSEEAFSSEVSATVGGPEILANPLDEYVALGGTASFGVAADTTGGSLTYQWEYSDNSGSTWADAVGETSSRIDVAGLTDANSGRLYRCKVSNGVATTTSESATATVYARTYHLDTYPALAAYGLRKLSAAYLGDCVQIFQTENPSQTYEVGFDADGKISESDLGTAYSTYGGEWRIGKFYDQSGNGNDLTLPVFSSDGILLIDVAGNYPTGRDGDICIMGYTNAPSQYYQCTLASPVTRDDFSGYILERIDSSVAKPLRLTGVSQLSDHFAVGNCGFQANNRTQLAITSNPAASVRQALDINREYGKSLISFSVGTGKPVALVGMERAVWGNDEVDFASPVGGTSSSLQFWPMAGIEVYEFGLYDSVLTESQLRDRMLLVNRNWMCCAPDTAFVGSYGHLYKHWKLLSYCDQFATTDLRLPFVSAKTATSITVSGRDYSWLQPGAAVRINDGTTTLTVSSTPPVFADGSTEIFVNESTDSVSQYDEVHVDPYWDGSTADLNFASGLEILFRNLSNTNLSLPSRPAKWPANYFRPKHEGAKYDLALTKSANLYAAQPDSTGLSVGVGRDASGFHAVELYQFSMAALLTRPNAAYLSFSDFSFSGGGDRIRVMVKVYEDIDFNSGTVTWNTSPITLSPLPSDYDGRDKMLISDDGLKFDITAPIQSAYDSGASTVTILLYQGNEINGDTQTVRFLKAENPNISCFEKCGFVPLPFAGVVNLQFRQSSSHVNGAGRRDAAVYSHVSLPLASGSDGNPLRYWHPLARRLVAANISSMLLKFNILRYDKDGRQVAGYLEYFTSTFDDCSLVIDPVTRECLEDLLLEEAEAFRQLLSPTQGSGWENANMTCKGVEGLGALYKFISSARAADKARVVQICKHVVLGKENGDITTNDVDLEYALMSLEGCVREGKVSPIDRAIESDYQGRSWAHFCMCRHWTYGDPAWDWFDDVLDRMFGFIPLSSFDDNGRISGISIGGRTKAHPLVNSQYHWFGNISAASQNPNWYWMARNWKTLLPDFETSLPSAIASAKNRIAGTNFGVSRPLTDRPIYENIVYPWPDEVSVVPPVSGWADSMAAAFGSSSPGTFMPGTAGNWTATGITLIPNDSSLFDYLSVSKGAGSELYRATIAALTYAGGYLGTTGPQLNMFVTSDFGCFIHSKRISQVPVNESTPNYELDGYVSLWCETVQIRTDIPWNPPSGPTTAHFNFDEIPEHTTRTKSWNGSDTLTVTQAIPPSDSRTILSTNASYVMTKVFRVLDKGVDGMEGIEIDVTLDYTPDGTPDQVSEINQVIPIFQSNDSDLPDFYISYYNGSLWIPIFDTFLDTWISGATWLKATRDYGAGPKECWIKFDGAQSIKLESTTLTGNASQAKLRRVLVDMHPNTGTMTNIPSSSNLKWTVTSTDPLLAQTGIFAAMVLPSAGDVLPVDGAFAAEAYVNWGSDTPGTVEFQYSTDYAGDEGAATWNTIGSGVLNEQYYECSAWGVPASLAAIRVVATSVELSTDTGLVAVTSAATSVTLSDTFTDTDNVLLTAHTPDTNTFGALWTTSDVTRQLKILSNATQAISGRTSNGCFNRCDVGGPDYIVKCAVTTPSSNSSAGDRPAGPYVGGRVSGAGSQFAIVKLCPGLGVNVEMRGGFDSADSSVFRLFNSWLPSTSTTYVVEVQLQGSVLAFRVLSSDELTTHAEGVVFTSGNYNEFDYPSIGVTGLNGTHDNITVRTW